MHLGEPQDMQDEYLARASEVLRALDKGNTLLAECILDGTSKSVSLATIAHMNALRNSTRVDSFSKNYVRKNAKAFDQTITAINLAQEILGKSSLRATGLIFGGELDGSKKGALALAQSRVFEISASDLRAAGEATTVEAIQSPYLIAPFPKFAIFPSEPILFQGVTFKDIEWNTLPDISEKDQPRVVAFWVDATTNEWQCYARLRAEEYECDIVANLDVDEGVLIASIDASKIVQSLLDELRDPHVSNILRSVQATKSFADETEEKLSSDLQNEVVSESIEFRSLTRIIVGFCLLLNSKNVETPPANGSKTDVRNEDIDGDGPRRRRPRYRVVITKSTATKNVRAVLRHSENVRARKPHWVRKHPRTYKDGYIAIVRRHTRGGDPGFYLPLYEVKHGRQPATPRP